MRYYKESSLLILMLLTSCKSAAFMHPYSLSPTSYEITWESGKAEVKKLASIELERELIIPNAKIDSSLGDLFDIALHNNPSTQSTWSKARAAAAEYGENLSSYIPSLVFDGEFNANREGFVFNTVDQPSTFLMNTQIQYGPIISLTYLLFDGGERKAKAGKYFWALQTSNFLHNENLQSIMKAVAENYYTYLSKKAQYEADLEDLKNAELAYKAASDKYTAGIYSITDMLQAKTNYLQKKVNVTNGKNLKDNSLVALNTTLSIPASSTLEVRSFPKEILSCPFEDNIDALIKLGKSLRGEYLAAKANYLSCEQDLKMAETAMLPQLNLSAQGGEYWYQNGFQDTGNYNILLDLSIPIFDGFFYKNQVKNKKSLLAKAKADMFSTELSIIEEIQIARNDLNAAKQKILDTKSYLDAAEVENDAMLKRYKRGVVSILDLLSAQAFLADAKASYIVAQKDYYTAIISLSFSTGLLSTQKMELGYEK
jgi:outer membrane protein